MEALTNVLMVAIATVYKMAAMKTLFVTGFWKNDPNRILEVSR